MSAALTAYPLHELRDALQGAVSAIVDRTDAPGTPRVEFERPRDEAHGDFASNVALMLAPVVGANPREIAAELAEAISGAAGVSAVDVAGPGFINLRMSDDWFAGVLATVLEGGDRYGTGVADPALRIHLEYVSANPLGPVTAAAARHAAFGDSLARILAFAGHTVHREYYLNDRGRQVRMFGESILARARGEEPPADGGYHGAYVSELASELGAGPDDDAAELGRRGVEKMVGAIRASLARFGVEFDNWQSEQALHDDGTVATALERLEEGGHTYVSEGARFLRTTGFGDDKDRAIVRSDGDPTYFASDLGYIVKKQESGNDRAVYVLGADHHGYVERLRSATQALGYRSDWLEVLIMQMVSLVEAGKQKKVSKRAGNIVTLDELVDRIEVDAARWYLIERSHDQSLEIDLDLATEQSDKNPVHYVKYAHARCCSIMRKVADELGIEPGDAAPVPAGELEPAERRLIKRIAEFPVTVGEAADRRAPHRIAAWSLELAQDFAQFYRDCRVMGDGIEAPTTRFRIELVRATRTVLASALGLLGVSAPERM